jgi:hypothetical protein
MKKQYLYFSGETLLVGTNTARRTEVEAKFPGVKLVRTDSFSVWIGWIPGAKFADYLPVTRVIAYKPDGSKHKCDSRCQSAKGGNCECSCGGKYHGILSA